MSWINKTQYGTITIAAGANSGTATVTSVDTAKAFILFNNFHTADTTLNVAEDLPRLDLQDATTVRARTNTINAGADRIVPFMLVEGNSLVTSVQQFSILLSGVASNTASISTVDTARSAVIHNGQVSASASDNIWNYNQHRVRLTSSTQVTGSKESVGSGGNSTVNGVVVEWDASIITSVQEVSATIAASAATQDTTVTAVTDGKAFLFWGGWEIGLFGSAIYQRAPYVHRTSTTNVRGTRGSSVTSTTSLYTITLVDFNTVVTRRTAGQVAIATGTASVDTTLGVSINREQSLLLWLGQTTDTSGQNNGAINFASISLPDANTVRQTRGATDTMTVTTSWELGEFNDALIGSLVLAGQTLSLKQNFPIPAGSLTLSGFAPALPQSAFVPLGEILLNLPEASYTLYAYQEIEDGTNTYTEKVGTSVSYYEKQEGVVPDTIFLDLELKTSLYKQSYGMTAGALALGTLAPLYKQTYAIPAGSLILTGQVPTI